MLASGRLALPLVAVVAATCPTVLAAQGGAGSPPRVTVAVLGGVAGAGSVVSGRVVTTVSGASTSGLLPSRSERSVDLRLDGRASAGAEVRVRLGAGRRWAAVAEVARASGGARMTRAQSLTVASRPGVFQTGEQFGRYERVTAWRGALGVARAFALPAAWSADVGAGAVVMRLRGSANPGVCAGLAGFPLAACQAQASGSALPAFSVTAPGAAVGAGLESPAWRRVRLRGRVGADALWADGAGLLRSLEPDLPSLYPAGTTDVRDADGPRRVRVLPSASLGLAVGLGR